MTWNYRIVRYKDPDFGYGLHEVYYNEDGSVWAMSKDPDGFVGDSREELVETLIRAVGAAKRSPVFIEPDEWAERAEREY